MCPQTSGNGNRTRTFLALGDSYTIGEGIDAAGRWPVQLAGLLRQSGIALASPDIIAQTGWTTNALRVAIRDSGNGHNYDLVSLMIGVNNQYRQRSLNRYRTHFRELLQTAVALAGGRVAGVLVLSIPDWGVSPFARRRGRAKISAQIDAFNAVAQAECFAVGIAYVDITCLSRGAAGDAAQFAPDGLHYSASHMQQWAGLALPVAKTCLGV